MRGLGEEIINTDAVMTALGSTITLSYQNPGYPIRKENIIFEAGIISNNVLGIESDNRRFISNVRPNYLKGIFVLPLDFSFSLGLSERFNQNFNIYSDTLAFLGYQRQIVGCGGIFSFKVGVAKSFYQHFGLGIEYNRNFGNAYEHWFFEVLPSGTITTDTITTDYRGDALKFGICTKLSNFNLAILYEKTLPIYIDSKTISHNIITDSIFGLKFEFPPRIGFGLSFNPTSNLIICLDYFHRNSGNTKIADTLSPIFCHSNKYSLGFAYQLNEKYIIRIGYRYFDWYLTASAKQIINEQALTIGSGIPIPKFGSFNFALELINRRGGTLTEDIARLNLTLHYEETWKIRKRRWGY